jgi:hypothetical protein
MQQNVLIARDLPGYLRALEFSEHIDLKGAQAAEAFKRQIQLTHKLLVSLRQAFVP